MKKRINELARELEVKPGTILDMLPELGVTEKKTHSSSLDDHIVELIKQRLAGSAGEQYRLAAAQEEHAEHPPKPAPAVPQVSEAPEAQAGAGLKHEPEAHAPREHHKEAAPREAETHAPPKQAPRPGGPAVPPPPPAATRGHAPSIPIPATSRSRGWK
ncbi:MAG: translation initiation factor IF-2 N-terminal domain-containing protein [Bryobacteraceae bacterium]|nr:translation initiation factor IF-2 N-terminal domain-containing protein [Bryobacteraceae bacterium]